MTALAPLLRLARPHQWAKGAFVVVGPLYAIASGTAPTLAMAAAVAAAFVAFGFAASSNYIINDLRDIDADRLHPRKRLRPLPAGEVSPAAARSLAIALGIAAALAVAASAIPALLNPDITPAPQPWLLALAVAVYFINTTLYSLILKHHAVLDVLSLALGFVLRVLGGCAAAGVMPSLWLLNVTLFLAMFLAFGKRLGERRTMGSAEAAATTRRAQATYSDDILRMCVVVTAVATLLTYALYVQAQAAATRPTYTLLLWLTILPAMYGLLRAILLVERGDYDDPTELASSDRPFQLAALAFGFLTVLAVVVGRRDRPPLHASTSPISWYAVSAQPMKPCLSTHEMPTHRPIPA